MFISGLLFFIVMIGTWLSKRPATPEELDMPISETIHGGSETPSILDRMGLWFIVAVVLVIIAYVPVFLTHSYNFTSQGFTLF